MSEPTLDQWRHLYGLAVRIWDLKPWDWLLEHQVFAVRDPEDPNRLGFVSVMGAASEFPAVIAYLGQEALWNFRRLTLHPENFSMEEVSRQLLLLRQIMLSFEQPTALAPEDRDRMARLEVDWQGELYPVFRSSVPAYLPWFLEADEARFLALVLEQTLEVAPLVQCGEITLRPDDHPRYYIRILVEDEDGVRWEGRWEKVEPPPLRRVRFSLPEAEVEKAGTLPQREDTLLEVQMELAPALGPIQNQPGERPFFPYFFMAVWMGGKQPQVAHVRLIQPAEAPQLAESFAHLLLETFHKIGERPREVRMAPRAHYVQVAQWLSGLLDFRVRVEPLTYLPETWDFVTTHAGKEAEG